MLLLEKNEDTSQDAKFANMHVAEFEKNLFVIEVGGAANSIARLHGKNLSSFGDRWLWNPIWL